MPAAASLPLHSQEGSARKRLPPFGTGHPAAHFHSPSPGIVIHPFYRKVRGSAAAVNVICPRPLLPWGEPRLVWEPCPWPPCTARGSGA